MARILLVDDEEDVRKIWGKLFEEEGYEVTTAGSKEEAHTIILITPAFEVAIVDMCLSPKDRTEEGGLRVIEKLKEKDFFTQVIAVTAYMSVGEVVQNIYEAIRFAPYQYMDKNMPHFLENLLEEIKNAIRYREAMIERALGRKKGKVPYNIPSHIRQEERDKELIEGLRRYRMITSRQLNEALEEKKQTNNNLENILLKKEILSKGQIAWILSKQFNIEYVYVTVDKIDKNVVQSIPVEILVKHCLIPIAKINNNMIVVTDDPWNKKAIQEIEKITKCQIIPFIGSTDNIITTINKLFFVKEYLVKM